MQLSFQVSMNIDMMMMFKLLQTVSNWTQTLPALVLLLLVRRVLELVLSAGPGPAVAAAVLLAL